MKKSYYSKDATRGPWDYVVIGSGMGGMSCAALLTRLGKRVLVLEQHRVPGGFTHTFKRKKWLWDVGVHAVGEVTDKSMVGRLLREITYGKLEWTTLGPVYDEFFFPDDFSINFPDSPEKFRQALVDAFPSERNAIDQYLRMVREVAAAMRGHYLSRVMPQWLGRATQPVLGRTAQRFLTMRTADVIAGLTQNKRLRTVLTAQWGYYGSPPSQASWASHALTAKHFFYGGYYPVGGSARIAECLLAPVVERGGGVRVKADVDQIMMRRGRAVGVRLKDGEEILSKRVVSAAGALTTVRDLLPESETRARWASSIRTLKPSAAHVCLYLGFKGDIASEGCGSANKWFYDTWDHDFTGWDYKKPGQGSPVLYTSFPSLKDPQHVPGPDQRHTGEVVTFLPFDDFARFENTRWRKRGAEYDALKAELSERIQAQFLERLPGLKSMIAYDEFSTPSTTRHFCRSAEGSIYGLQASVERWHNPWLRPRTPIKNLYMAGVDVGMVGVIGAMLGGTLAAAAAEPTRAIRFMSKL